MSLMAMSISGAVLILVILAVRAGLKGRLPKRTFAVLWTVALFRLLIPFSVPSPWSVYTLLQNAASQTEQTGQGRGIQSALGNELLGSAIQSRRSESGVDLQSETGRQGSSVSGAQSGPQPDLAESSGKASEETLSFAEQFAKILPLLRGIWAAGFLLFAIAFSWMYFRCCREFRMSLPFEDYFLDSWQASHPLWRKLSIRQSDQIASPLSYGVWHPVILLPKSAKCGDRFRLRYVLEHEYMHIRYFDAAVKLLMAAALCLHWFNPCVYLMYIFFNRDLEFACDEAVVRRFGEEQKSAYAMALIEMEEEKSGLFPLGNSFSKNAIEERIGAIMKMKKTTPAVYGLSTALVCGIILLFATSCGSYGEAENNMEARPQAEMVDVEETNADNSVSTKSLSAVLEESSQGGLGKGKTPVRFFIDKKEETAVAEKVKEAVMEDVEKVIAQKQAEAEAVRQAEKAAEEAVRETEKAAEEAKEQTAEIFMGSDTDYTADNRAYSVAYAISIGEEFEEYKKFGLSYDKKTDFLMYQNQTVGYFKDEAKPNVYTRLVEGSGKLGITVNRDQSGKITDFSVFPFDESSMPDSSVSENTAVKEGSGLIRWDDSGGEALSGEAAYSEGDPDEKGTSLPKEYKKFGIKVSNEKTNQWTYQGKEVAVIYDKGHWIYANDTVPEKKAAYLEVVRDKKDRITSLREVSKKEIQRLIDEE